MDKKFDLITLGDSTIDTFIKIHDATVECDINHEECKICVTYGDKIPVDSIAHSVAGNAANVAIGGSRLGLKTAIYTNLGSDDHGWDISKILEREKVAPDYIVFNDGKESNLSVVLTFQGERTIFVYHQDWYYKLPNLATCSWLYLTSMAKTFTNTNIMDEVCYYVDKAHAKLIFSPGTHQIKADIKRFPRLLERCWLLIVNLEEGKKILGIDLSATVDPKDLLSKLLLLGSKAVVITDGEEGSYAFDGHRSLRLGIVQTQIVEKTGAGDAYASGLIAALARGLDLSEAMVWGTINASWVISKIGPGNGLLTHQGMANERQSRQLAAVPF